VDRLGDFVADQAGQAYEVENAENPVRAAAYRQEAADLRRDARPESWTAAAKVKLPDGRTVILGAPDAGKLKARAERADSLADFFDTRPGGAKYKQDQNS
jgi:hypothetical protein